MQRIPNWDVALIHFCNAMQKQARIYSLSDCLMFGAGCVEVQTGVDYAAPHRGKYADDLESARAYMASQGWADVDDVVDSFLPRVDVAMRKRGDILAFHGPLGKSIGVCLGRFAMVLSPSGGVHYQSSLAFAAWSVGDA